MDLAAVGADDEALLLDLLNTTPVVDGIPHDELADPKSARAWLRRHGMAAGHSELAALVDARSVLQAVVRGEQKPTALQKFLRAANLRPKATGEGLDWQLTGAGGHVVAARAVVAWDALRVHRPGRLRPCANPDCRLFLIDRSKPNTARWCSMAICGNRIKARRHYRRARDAEDA